MKPSIEIKKRAADLFCDSIKNPNAGSFAYLDAILEYLDKQEEKRIDDQIKLLELMQSSLNKDKKDFIKLLKQINF